MESSNTEAVPVRVLPTERIPRLVVTTGASQGNALLLSRGRVTVGRHTSNDLVVADLQVSSVHLEVKCDGHAVRVVDLDSTNGTWLGANQIREATLAEGTVFRIGSSTLRVDLDEDAVAPRGVSEGVASLGGLVGASRSMHELFEIVERVADKNLSVLIQGETGTGKEELARALHGKSARARGPFVVIDATSLPETLVESLLFGHEKGAFTGATERHAGLFEVANGGTIFLDEIGELVQPLQSKFLRVLERHEVVRVGGHSPIKVDVRVVAATNRDLRTEIEHGRFREDLFFRLAQVHLFVPPLRDRKDDVPLLCRKLLLDSGADVMIDQAALEHLASRSWPGNVRELKNVLMRATALVHDGIIRRADVAGEGSGFRGTASERDALELGGTFATAKERAIERFEKAYLSALMRRCSGNLSRASREADVARHYLRDLLRKRSLYGLPSEGDE